MRSERIVVVGAGPAGVSAAVQCLRLGIRPCLLDESGASGGLIRNAYRIENLVGLPPCDGQTFAGSLRDHLTLFGLRVEEGAVHRVTASWNGFSLKVSLGDVQAQAVILAVGTKPQRLAVPGLRETCAGRVFYEVRDLLEAIPKVETAAVVGGGEAAIDYALSLARVAREVVVLVRGERPKAARRLIALAEETQRIRIACNATVTSCQGDAASLLLDVSSQSGTTRMAAEALLVAVGRDSRVPDIVAADVAGSYHEVKPRPGLPLFIIGDARHGGLGQVGMAIGDGLAAAAMAVEAIG